MAGEERSPEDTAAAVLEGLAPVATAGVGVVAPAAAPIVPAVIEAIRRVLQEAELARLQGEVLDGQALLVRSAQRVAEAAADPGLPPEARQP